MHTGMTVFSTTRTIRSPKVAMPNISINSRVKQDGLKFMSHLPSASISVAFFDPQYRGVYEKMAYGNEFTSRNYKRVKIPQMHDDLIVKFVKELSRILSPSGHLFLWVDKFHLCTNFKEWFVGTDLEAVDMITWNKLRMGLGYRSRHTSEFLVVLQKSPKRAKGVWMLRDIPDVWDEKQPSMKKYSHSKPVGLQSKLIEAVTEAGDVVLDPAAGSYTVLDACKATNRTFIGCDIQG